MRTIDHMWSLVAISGQVSSSSRVNPAIPRVSSGIHWPPMPRQDRHDFCYQTYGPVVSVARIQTNVDHDHLYVSVRGSLLAREVRLLEQACGRALEQRDLHLTVDLDDERVPPAACAFLLRLHARGAQLTGPGRHSVLGFRG